MHANWQTSHFPTHWAPAPGITNDFATYTSSGLWDSNVARFELGAASQNHLSTLPATSSGTGTSDRVSPFTEGSHDGSLALDRLSKPQERRYYQEPEALRSLPRSTSIFQSFRGIRYTNTGEAERSKINSDIFDGKLKWVQLDRTKHHQARAFQETRVLPFLEFPDPTIEGATRKVRIAVHGGLQARRSTAQADVRSALTGKTYWSFFSLPESANGADNLVHWHGMGHLDLKDYGLVDEFLRNKLDDAKKLQRMPR
ncbi:related to Effector family protein Eff1 [Sporisorium scitamineum]|uniref:Related to Effector family protein Eff1 n=1 Tax=Sporisorium scitamineum TaxID=49012 RepID=A0A0F7RZQ9_9BASI|nr:hypothetical protein [Sporisorium scitamineum]CDU26037.1 related to Effector family protein Eff1 [Sporisorium scitamineum]